MKASVRHLALFAFFALILSPLAVVHASPSPADSLHFCGFDYEQWRRDHPRPAGKRLADLNRGEPRTVRTILFSPNDRPFRTGLVDSIKTAIKQSQAFFGEQMEAYGYGYMTFRFETDAQGEPLVHRVDGQHPESHYFEKTSGVLHALYWREIEQVFDLEENIYVIYRDISQYAGPATGFRRTKKQGYANMPPWGANWKTLSHESGHAFGLPHDFRDGAYILSYGGPSQFPDVKGQDRISACAAEFLSVHPYFNSAIPIEVSSAPTIAPILISPTKDSEHIVRWTAIDSSAPTIKLISPPEYPAGLKSVSIQFEVSDADGLHQVLLEAHTSYGSRSLRECRAFDGERDVVVEFDYDGSSMAADPEGAITSLSDSPHSIRVSVVDTDGNRSRVQFDLTETVPSEDLYTLTKVSGDEQQGPAGTALAEPFVVSVLDQNGSAFAGVVVTFSVLKGGGTLSTTTAITDANGRARSRLTLGPEPGTNTVTATVAGLEPVTFTATATEQMPQTLTKVSGEGQGGSASTQLTAPLVVSVLDQDDSPLAGVVVSFSITAGEGLLSSPTATNSCTVGSSTSSTTATTDANGQAATRLTLGSQPGTNTVEATVEGLEPVTFTASASEQVMPHRLTKLCGDGQEGTAGALLDAPFVVSVLAEDGAAMAGVVVSFAVTAGEGTLSSATATTNANGRAATRLTLGSEPGTNTVATTVEGLEPVIFTTTGKKSDIASLFDAFFGGGKRVALPDSPQLAQNAPNPFNSQTILAYYLPAASSMRLEMFTLTGQRVAVLYQGLQQAGYHRLRWHGRDDAGRPVASGMYLYRLVTEEAVLPRKLVLLR